VDQALGFDALFIKNNFYTNMVEGGNPSML